MDPRRTLVSVAACLALAVTASAPCGEAAPRRQEVLAAMKKATRFMCGRVAYRGGFVRLYTEDLSGRWGEVPARKSMIWVQDPGTVSVGRVLLEAYQAIGDGAFLRGCQAAANALVWGQHPAGGWNYFIDFAPAGTHAWYERVGAKCWGWEEFYHDYGNCTFDDRVTAGAADFLLDLYAETRDPKYRAPVFKAIQFVLDAQYPLGGWPQRYPPRQDPYAHGPIDYTTCYTFNDGVIANNIDLLLKAYARFGDPDYRRAALRGMRFVALAQLPAPQAGWAQQHDMDLRPAAARSYEPAALSPATTATNIRHLMRFYQITGDRRFLRGIPDALHWLEASKLPPGHATGGQTHAMFLEVGTNRPLYAHREGTNVADGRYWVDNQPGNFPGHYGMQFRLDVAALRTEYRRVAGLKPAAAMAEYRAEQQAATPAAKIDTARLRQILASMDERGAWIEDVSVPDYTDWKFLPHRHFRGIQTATYVRNMRILIHYWERLPVADRDKARDH